MSSAERLSLPLLVERRDDGRRKLMRDLVIDLGVDVGIEVEDFDDLTLSDRGTTVITVPAGFTTDFSSIPGPARALYRFDSVDLAGCCHDYAYYVGLPKAPADEIWRLVAMSGRKRIGRVRGRLGWLALRLGGGRAYRGHTERRSARKAEEARAAAQLEVVEAAQCRVTAVP